MDTGRTLPAVMSAIPTDIYASVRKSNMQYEYEIQGNYGYGWDMLTTEATLPEARAQLATYQANESIPLRIKRVRGGE